MPSASGPLPPCCHGGNGSCTKCSAHAHTSQSSLHGMKGFSLPGARGTAQITPADSADGIYQSSPAPRSTQVTVNCTRKSGFGGPQPFRHCTFPSAAVWITHLPWHQHMEPLGIKLFHPELPQPCKKDGRRGCVFGCCHAAKSSLQQTQPGKFHMLWSFRTKVSHKLNWPQIFNTSK